MNHSFEVFQTQYYQLQEIKDVADRVIKNNKDGIHGYYITKQEILELNM